MIRIETFEADTEHGTRHFFRLVAEGNNEIIAPSQPYKSERARDHAIRLIRHGAFSAKVVEGKAERGS